MRRIFPFLLVAAALLAAGILYLFVRAGDTAHTGQVPQAETGTR